jgi:hypothetical protein
MKFFNILKGTEKQLGIGLLHSEFWCRCKHVSCKSTPIHQEFIDAYVRLRVKLNVPLRITSGFRCHLWNHECGGTARSYHQYGLALDFAYENAVTNYPVEIILKHIQEAGFQFSYYNKEKNFFHIQLGRFT